MSLTSIVSFNIACAENDAEELLMQAFNYGDIEFLDTMCNELALMHYRLEHESMSVDERLQLSSDFIRLFRIKALYIERMWPTLGYDVRRRRKEIFIPVED